MVQYIIIIVILLIIGLAIARAKRKDFTLEANNLVEYLGGKKNIVKYEVNISRFLVEVVDTSLVNKDAIQKLGAKGIVEVDNQLKIIFGSDAKNLKKCIDELKK